MELSKRLDLHEMLCEILGSSKCYFQPPESVKLEYPCIIYKYDNNTRIHADDVPYNITHQYIVTLVTRDPDDPRVNTMTELPRMRFDRYYTADNLHHYSFVYIMSKEARNG